ncbi:nucleotide pyrophosphatase [Halobacteriales archaeon QS_6_64_34]|nr:MAG: nucleotide pyrophosphatase [Halobacteriales archaeon QS_6_64_34]
MLRSDVERRLRERQADDGYLLPAYGDYCFGSVPGTIGSLVGVENGPQLPSDVFEGVRTDAATVVVVVVDGYGLNSWKRDRSTHPFLSTLTERGRVTPLTSVYPSETAAAMTTFETGQYPCEHGRVGWNVYEPETDRSFVALGGEVKAGGDGEITAPEFRAGVDYHYDRFDATGVDCHRVQPFPVATDGVTHHTYDGLGEFGSTLADAVERVEDPGYVYGYLNQIDHVSHTGGTDSAAFQRTLETVCDQLTDFVDTLDTATAEETLLLVTADHGHVNTDPGQCVDLDTFETVRQNRRRHRDGTPIRLAGSPRNVHLHLEDGTVAATRAALADLDAQVFTREEALERGLFGPHQTSDRFRRRCGDLVVTHRRQGVWFGDIEPEAFDQVGLHGGLSPAEMLVPFAAVRADRLRG